MWAATQTFLARLAAALVAPILLATAAAQARASEEVPFITTPDPVAQAMLELARVKRRDYVIDLGSGDGRVPIHAARHFGVRAIGVELAANPVRLSNQSASAEGVEQLVQFIRGDLFEADLSRATGCGSMWSVHSCAAGRSASPGLTAMVRRAVFAAGWMAAGCPARRSAKAGGRCAGRRSASERLEVAKHQARASWPLVAPVRYKRRVHLL